MVPPCAGSDDASLLARLRRALPRGRLLTAPAQLAGYETDGIGHKRHRPDAVAIPADADELLALVQALQGEALPFTLRGAGTSLSGGPVAAQGGLIIHTSRLRRIEAVNTRDLYAVVEAGVVLNHLGAALKPLGLHYPPDPSSGAACTLGGNVAANAGGAHCFRYGVTGNYVLGVEAILLDGQVVRCGGPAGGRGAWRDDWKRLLVGSEGTLGALTRLWLRLAPAPGKAWTFRATFRDVESASAAIRSLACHPAAPAAIELMDPRFVDLVENSPMAVGLPRGSFLLLAELEGPGPLVDRWVSPIEGLLRDQGATEVASGDQPERRESLWRARKVAGGLMGQISPDYLVQDAVIPRAQLAAVLEFIYAEADAEGVPVVNVFHAGDGNLHPNFLFDARRPEQVAAVERISHRLMHHVIAVGGTLSGEHGIGDDKSAYATAFFGPTGVALQVAVPRVFNPRHQLNPLKVFPERRFAGGASPSGQDLHNSPASQDAGHFQGCWGGPPRETRDRQPGDAPLRSSAIAPEPARLFTAFFDPIDMVMCCSAETSLAEVNTQAAAAGLRFPLVGDPAASLRAHVAAIDYASGSARFGPYVDNILGMNWELPSGTVVRVGERVIKSTTGYDLQRFLLHSDGRYGRARDYVLRLRPLGGAIAEAVLHGDLAALEKACDLLLHSPWLHWLDAVDLVLAADRGPTIEISADCGPGEEGCFADFFRQLGHDSGCLVLTPAAPRRRTLPALSLKSTLSEARTLGAELVRDLGGAVRVLVANGVVHYCPAAPVPGLPVEALAALAQRCTAVGGHLSGPLAPAPTPSPAEARWAVELETAWKQL